MAQRAEVTFSGSVRIKPASAWLPFRGQEIIEAAKAYRVRAKARLGPLPVTTQEWYENGTASSRILLLGFIPVMTSKGENAALTGRGRLVVEATWLPTSFLPQMGASWEAQEHELRLTLPVDGQQVSATFHLEANGQLRKLQLQRWSNLTPDKKYAPVPFAAYCEAEQTFGDFTVPSQIRAVWWPQTNQEFEFFQATVENIVYSA